MNTLFILFDLGASWVLDNLASTKNISFQFVLVYSMFVFVVVFLQVGLISLVNLMTHSRHHVCSFVSLSWPSSLWQRIFGFLLEPI